MFTGLIQAIGTITDVRAAPPGKRFTAGSSPVARPNIGDSIAVNGCCLTVVEVGAGGVTFEAGPETLARTTLGELAVGSRVNLEPSLAVGDRLGGHFVTGHVDAVGKLLARSDDRAWSTMWFGMDAELAWGLAPKGSVAIDGVSLTVVDVEQDRFSVAIIPHTLAATTLGELSVGGKVNLEIDLVAKYVRQLLASGALAVPG